MTEDQKRSVRAALPALVIAVGVIASTAIVAQTIIRIKGDQRDYSIEVSGAARRTAKADRVSWVASVEMSAPTAQEGHVGLQAVRDRLRSHIEGRGVPAAAVKFPAVEVAPIVKYDAAHNESITGYRLTQRVRVDVDDSALLQKLLAGSAEIISAAGIEGSEFVWRPGDLHYEYTQLDGIKQQVLAEAIKNARARVATMAAAAGVGLDRLRQVQLDDIQVRSPGSSERYSDDLPSATKDIIANVRVLYLVR